MNLEKEYFLNTSYIYKGVVPDFDSLSEVDAEVGSVYCVGDEASGYKTLVFSGTDWVPVGYDSLNASKRYDSTASRRYVLKDKCPNCGGILKYKGEEQWTGYTSCPYCGSIVSFESEP